MNRLPFFLLLVAHSALAASSYGFQPQMIINEIFFAPEDSELEFIELLNISRQPQDLCAFSFSDNRDVISPICNESLIILPETYAVLAKNGGFLSTFFTGRSFTTPPSWPALNNSGDAVRLYRGSDLIDEVEYASSWGERGYSIERVDPAGPSWASFNWQPSKSPFKATPGERNSVYAPDQSPPGIRIAEKERHAEVYIVFDEPIDTSFIAVDQFRIRQDRPQHVEVLSDTTVRIYFAREPTGEFLVTRDLKDFTNNRSPTQSTPLAFIPQRGDVLVNEILYEPLSDDFDARANQPEYVELFNASDRPVSLRHIRLAGPENEEGEADSLTASALYPIVSPQQFALFYARAPSLEINQAFPSMLYSAASTELLPVTASSLGLLNTGDTIRIIVSDSTIDEVLFDPSWHYPDLISTRGISLERRSTQSRSTDPSNWSSSVHPEGGTPGYPNSIHVEKSNSPPSMSIELAPTPFTPNGDGIDDVLSITIQPSTYPQSLRIRIFDSRGRLVRDLVPAGLVGQESVYIWDGTSNEQEFLPTGIYIVFIELQDRLQNEVQKTKKIAVLAHP